MSEHLLYKKNIMIEIQDIYKRELDCLKDGVKNGKSSYHTFAFSSISGNYPESRTVVLRGLDLDILAIYFNADYRSPKIQELKDNHFCSALFYDQDRRIQLRFKCKATLHHQNDVASKVWEGTALQSRKCYMGPYSPSERLNEHHPNIPLEYLKTDPEKEHSQEGYVNFAHIELKIIELDILELHYNGHIRFMSKNGVDLHYVAP